jgi:hypothetical protein
MQVGRKTKNEKKNSKKREVYGIAGKEESLWRNQ